MINFFLTDLIASLALLVLLGGIVFFIYTLRSIFWLEPEEKVKKLSDEPSVAVEDVEDVVEDTRQGEDPRGARQGAGETKLSTDMETKLEQINHKLEEIQRILTDLSEKK